MSQIECIGLTAVQPVCNVSIQCSDTVGWATGRASGLWKNWVMLCWWWRFDWSFARLIAPVVTTHHLQSSFALIKPANRGSPGKRPLKRRERERERSMYWYWWVLWSSMLVDAVTDVGESLMRSEVTDVQTYNEQHVAALSRLLGLVCPHSSSVTLCRRQRRRSVVKYGGGGGGVSQVKPSNCFRRIEKLVSPSVFDTRLSSLMIWNLQSYPTTVLNERMWHLKGSNMLGPLLHIFRGSGPPQLPMTYARGRRHACKAKHINSAAVNSFCFSLPVEYKPTICTVHFNVQVPYFKVGLNQTYVSESRKICIVIIYNTAWLIQNLPSLFL